MLLYSFYTFDYISTHPSNTIHIFAADTTTVGIISNNNETAYRDEACKLTEQSTDNNFTLIIKETEFNFDLRKHSEDLFFLNIRRGEVETVSSFQLLRTHSHLHCSNQKGSKSALILSEFKKQLFQPYYYHPSIITIFHILLCPKGLKHATCFTHSLLFLRRILIKWGLHTILIFQTCHTPCLPLMPITFDAVF